ncbi:hypothetical protein XELAEV_18008921mg [Xenopus laevis]|uniref:Uncharacterized protein n=1 Tax=Xenopus laevis TaxID=8355 RepID=A0A974I033_XENLA|nr:hypothetical protein XELAEV_18008921mg [Xenopus laevis]
MRTSSYSFTYVHIRGHLLKSGNCGNPGATVASGASTTFEPPDAAVLRLKQEASYSSNKHNSIEMDCALHKYITRNYEGSQVWCGE